MTLLELQKILGERILVATDETLTDEKRQMETNISQTISSLAKQMINNADIVLRADKLRIDGKIKDTKIKGMVG